MVKYHLALSLLVGAAVTSVVYPAPDSGERRCRYPADGTYAAGPYVSGPKFDGVVVTWGSWIPGRDDVRAIEESLPAYIEGRQSSAPLAGTRVPAQLGRYYRQYCGTRTRPKQILVMFAHSGGADSVKWLDGQPHIVYDGGDSFFSVTYEVAAGTFLNLQVNTPF
jgi:hypothetical protein